MEERDGEVASKFYIHQMQDLYGVSIRKVQSERRPEDRIVAHDVLSPLNVFIQLSWILRP